MKFELYSDGKINDIKVGGAQNYGKDAYLKFKIDECDEEFQLTIGKYDRDKGVIKTFGLTYIPKGLNHSGLKPSNYSIEIYRDLANIFSLKERTYKTGIVSFQTKTPHEFISDGIVSFFKCKSNGKIYMICLTVYGDYSRAPGLNVHVVGIRELSEELIEKLGF